IPAVSSGKVMVTGASGFIASWIVQGFPEHGFSVRGTVRTHAKGAQLLETFKKHKEQVRYVIVEDIAKEGAFDEAVKDVDMIVHTASPFTMRAQDADPDELSVPAVRGTTGIPLAAAHSGTALKRVVLTSSATAVMGHGTEPRITDEPLWNEEAVREVREKGRGTHAMNKYRASKTLAERAAWAFHEEHKADLAWDPVALNPPLVVIRGGGPREAERVPVPLLPKCCAGEDESRRSRCRRDFVGGCARCGRSACMYSLKSEAGGERILVSAGPFVWQDLVSVAHILNETRIAAGNEVYDPFQARHLVRCNTNKE
ncbi:hypothetical protein BD413DRAFT_639714, partial [Trametes elegans]